VLFANPIAITACAADCVADMMVCVTETRDPHAMPAFLAQRGLRQMRKKGGSGRVKRGWSGFVADLKERRNQ